MAPEVSFVHHRQGAQRWPLPAFADVPLAELVPVREPSNTHYQPQRPSRYWMATTGEHVTTRSRLAEGHLRDLDFDADIVDVRAEPFALHASEGTIKSRTPDFLAVRANGRRCVMDVISERRSTQQTVRQYLQMMARACDRLEWEHRVLGALDPVRAHNLSWLAGFRRSDTCEADIAQALLSAADEPLALAALADAAGPAWQTRPVLFHLLWSGGLVCDLAQPVGDESLIWRAAR